MSNYFGDDAEALQAAYSLADRPFKHVVSRLDSLLLVLKSCKGQECHDPWSTLHPEGGIKNLKHALKANFDVFYEAQPKVSYSSCQLGYLVDEEGPQHPHAFGADYQMVDQIQQRPSFRYQGELSWWT